MGPVLPGQRRILPQVGETLGHDAVVQRRRRPRHDPPELAAGAGEAAVDQRFEHRRLPRAPCLPQVAVLQLGQQRDGPGDPGQRRFGVLPRETRRRVGRQATHLAREPGVELAREHLVGLQVERAVIPELVARP